MQYFYIYFPSIGSYLREYSINRFGRFFDCTDYKALAAEVTKEQALFIISQKGDGKMQEIK